MLIRITTKTSQMIYSVHYTKKNGFMAFKGFPDKGRVTAEGDVVHEGKYQQPTVPGASRVYRPKYSLRKKQYLINLTQSELDKLVKEMHLYDEHGNLITEAPKSNESAKFWQHPQVSLLMENMSITLDDDNPRDRFFLRCFEADPQFATLGDEVNPAVAANVRFAIAKAEENVAKVDADADKSMRAVDLLNAMDYGKQVNVLRAMGVDSRNPDPKVVKNTLFRKITDEKLLKTGHNHENNLELFTRLASSTTSELNLQALVEQARTARVITKSKDNKYKFGEIYLGKTLSEVRDYLSHEDNEDVLNEIMEQCQ